MNRLYDLMKKQGITTDQLSGLALVGKNTISRLRNNDIDCRVSTILKLADFFGVSVEDFLNRK